MSLYHADPARTLAPAGGSAYLDVRDLKVHFPPTTGW